jgi:transposase
MVWMMGSNKAIQASPVWRDKEALYRGVAGIGPVISRTLIADLPELGRLSHREIATLVGPAPLATRQPHDERQAHDVPRPCAPVRSALYMAAVVGIRYNPVIRIFCQRTARAWKATQARRDRVCPQTSHVLNAMARTGEPWRLENA